MRAGIPDADAVRRICQAYCDDLVRPDPIPFARYAVYDRWLPQDGVGVLFVAEAPPWRNVDHPEKYRYFYNPDQTPVTGISREIFRATGIERATKRECLEAFRDRRLFLTDAVKCILNKDAHPHIPRTLIEESARTILGPEIEALDPEIVCVLGSTAMQAIKAIEPYAAAFADVRTITDAVLRQREEPVEADGRYVIVSPYPSARNDRQAIREAFSMINRLTRHP